MGETPETCGGPELSTHAEPARVHWQSHSSGYLSIICLASVTFNVFIYVPPCDPVERWEPTAFVSCGQGINDKKEGAG